MKLAKAKFILLVKASGVKKEQAVVSPIEQIVQQEETIIELLSNQRTLMPVWELAKGIIYEEPLFTVETTITIRRISKKGCDAITYEKTVFVDECIPLPIKSFKDMRSPEAILKRTYG